MIERRLEFDTPVEGPEEQHTRRQRAHGGDRDAGTRRFMRREPGAHSLEKCLPFLSRSARADDRIRSTHLLREAPRESECALSERRGRNRIDVHFIQHAAEPGDATDALLDARWRPRKVEVDHDAGILKIHALAQEIRAEEKIYALRCFRFSAVVCTRREARECILA